MQFRRGAALGWIDDFVAVTGLRKNQVGRAAIGSVDGDFLDHFAGRGNDLDDVRWVHFSTP